MSPPAPAVPVREGALPFTPTDLSREPIADVLAAMPIDHAVTQPWDLPGGERAARARWDAWRTAHLGTYHTRRTDAGDPGGASELSAHLHFGMIAPWRVAAEALAQGGPGAEKFLDELLTRRELPRGASAPTAPTTPRPCPRGRRSPSPRRATDARADPPSTPSSGARPATPSSTSPSAPCACARPCTTTCA